MRVPKGSTFMRTTSPSSMKASSIVVERKGISVRSRYEMSESKCEREWV